MDSKTARDGLSAIRTHHRDGRLQLATAAAKELLASDAAGDTASMLLEIRTGEGRFGDTIQLARDRLRVALPGTVADCAATVGRSRSADFVSKPSADVRLTHGESR